jgi:chloramphenicol O-acetyltransferase
MRFRSVVAIVAVTLVAAGTSRADFKYTQQSKVTGGALAGISKTLGVFSKSARQVGEPQISTTMVRGNRLRTEQATGTVEIIDLDGRRFIHIDTAKKSYTVQTFEQFKQQMELAQEKMKAEQAKAAAKHGDAQTMTMVPKFDMQATGATHTVMNIPAKEMKMRVDMMFKSTDPKTEADLEKSNASTWMTSDSWYGTIPGYDEVRQFYVKMAKELNWLPSSIGMGNPQMTQAAEEFKKNAVKMDGMPLLQYTSFGMAANGQADQGQPAGGQGSQQGQSTQAKPSSSDNSTPTSASGAITKGLGGLFKKKQQPTDSSAGANGATGATSAPPPPPPVAGSMMDMTIEVTSYSKDSLDASLFEVPAGYAQVQPDASGK